MALRMAVAERVERGQQLDDGYGIQSSTTIDSSTGTGSDLLPSNGGWNRHDYYVSEEDRERGVTPESEQHATTPDSTTNAQNAMMQKALSEDGLSITGFACATVGVSRVTASRTAVKRPGLTGEGIKDPRATSVLTEAPPLVTLLVISWRPQGRQSQEKVGLS
jgi:hypothetical protein